MNILVRAPVEGEALGPVKTEPRVNVICWGEGWRESGWGREEGRKEGIVKEKKEGKNGRKRKVIFKSIICTEGK